MQSARQCYSSGSYQDLEGFRGKRQGGVVGVHPFAMTHLSERVDFVPVCTEAGFINVGHSQKFYSRYRAS